MFLYNPFPNASILECNIGKGIHCYQTDGVTFVLANAVLGGLITKKIKEKAIKELESFGKQLLCVSVYNKKDDFLEASKVAWGSYVWFADTPKHTIYFDDNPQVIEPYTKNN